MALSSLKVNLQLSITRLKHLQIKKTELSKRSRLEIAEHLKNGKINRARIRVESILREDYLIESMEIIELYCDLLISRMGVLQGAKSVPPALEEAIASILWAKSYLLPDVEELNKISQILTKKYGKEFVKICEENSVKNVNSSLIKNLTYKVPDKRVVESYLVEIARVANIIYEPSPEIALPPISQPFVGFDVFNTPSVPNYELPPPVPGDQIHFGSDFGFAKSFPGNIPEKTSPPGNIPEKTSPPGNEDNDPNVDFDFDDLTKRFDALKKF